MRKKIAMIILILNVFLLGNYVYAIDFSDDNLAIGTFFSINYFDNGNKEVDDRIGLYATTNGSDFVYLGETGITGRDPRIIYHNDVFYMATTSGASASGGYSFNIFKSSDLINWTTDTIYPYVHHYDIDFVVNNKYGLRSNTWAPKWFVNDDEVYIIVISSRFDSDGARYYYIKGDELDKNGVIYNRSLSIDKSKGVLVKEYADLIDNRAQYVKGNRVYYTRDDQNNVYDLNNQMLHYDGNGIYVDASNGCTLDIRNNNKLSCQGNNSVNLTIKVKKEAVLLNDKLVQVQCPFYSPNYPVMDMYIAKVNFGSDANQKDINYQNISFSDFKKIKLSGFNENSNNSRDKNIYTKYGFLFGFIEMDESNTGYKYAMYLKTDPYGSMQRWVSNSLYEEWVQVDDGFYPLSYEKISSNAYVAVDNYNLDNKYVCNDVKKNVHGGRASTAIKINNNDDYAYAKHFEGAFSLTFNGKRYFYSDHYSADSEVAADYSNISLDEKRLNHYGIYYSVLDYNSVKDGVQYTDLTKVDDHLRFSVFRKVNVSNTSMRPSGVENNAIRNGCVYRANVSDMNKFKSIVENASKLNLSYKIYSTTDDNKMIAIIKSNRAIKKDEIEQWYQDGWRYVSEITSDQSVIDLNSDLVNQFSKFDKNLDISAPYSAKELYIYKIVEKDSVINLSLSDIDGNKKNISVNVGENIIEEQYLENNIELDDNYEVEEMADEKENNSNVVKSDRQRRIKLIIIYSMIILNVSSLIIIYFWKRVKKNHLK